MIDTHAHYDDSRFDSDREELIQSLFKYSVKSVINAGVDRDSSYEGLKYAEKYGGFYFAAGVHPHEASKYTEDSLEWIYKLAKHPKCVAVGEIGLDYHYDFSPRDIQKQIFEKQLDLAAELGKPVIIHDREAHADCISAVLAKTGLTGVFHSFSGSAETAEILQKNGWYISFSGIITFKNAEKTRKALMAVRDDRLLVETDCPYMTPHPHRGKRNDSSYIKYIIDVIAELKGASYEEIENLTEENSRRLFGLC